MAGPSPGRGQVAHARSRQQEIPRVQVVDLRTPAARSASEGTSSTSRAGAFHDALPVAAKPEAAGRDVPTAPGARDASSARGTAATPLERIRELTGGDLVKTAGIILRDGGGEIRLTLKPESLGSVRIRLRLADNGIEGRIVVDNQAAKQVFDAGLDALARALAADGFQTASLDVSVSGGDAGDARRDLEGPVGAAVAASRERESIGRLEAGVPLVETLAADRLVNLLA